MQANSRKRKTNRISFGSRRGLAANNGRATKFFRSKAAAPLLIAPPPDPPPPLLAIAPPPDTPVVNAVKEDRDWLEQEINRLLISAQFSWVLGSPPMCEWKGVNGAFAQISHVFPDLSRNLIARHSVYERMVCDLIERGLGLQHTTVLLNAELRKDNKAEVGASCVRETYNRLLPKIIQIRKVAMGTNDARSAWKKDHRLADNPYLSRYPTPTPNPDPKNIRTTRPGP